MEVSGPGLSLRLQRGPSSRNEDSDSLPGTGRYRPATLFPGEGPREVETPLFYYYYILCRHGNLRFLLYCLSYYTLLLEQKHYL